MDKVLDAIIERIDAPLKYKELNPKRFAHQAEGKVLPESGSISRALIFDSVFDQYK
ncbi:MAG: hypothetical protein H6765_02720 [Candidatus Peribacteria bacterium]|nr:MAG: hypothetical protein H6765_02720 [Candidatus Peribacteria bacterium]